LQQLTYDEIRFQHLLRLSDQSMAGRFPLDGRSRRTAIKVLHLLTELVQGADFSLHLGLNAREVHL
jgi:hypothetical protein